MKRLTTEEFIERARKVHGNKYDYSKTVYVNNRTKTCIICPEHGEFWQRPAHHLFNHGCPKCADNQKMTKEQFIKKAREIHANKYDYSKVEYKNNKIKICIICPEHGEFWVRPNDHLNDKGCAKCAGKNLSNEQIIERFRKVHGNKYNYSYVNYISNSEKVCIVCEKHGKFNQVVNYHLSGAGCPKCNQSKLENEIEKILSDEKINFEEQKHFEWLGRQSLDFFLPDYNIAIECQGEQHFKPISHFGGAKAYDYRLKCDEKKKLLCEKNGITLMYFTHYKNINNISDIYCNKESLLRELNNNIN